MRTVVLLSFAFAACSSPASPVPPAPAADPAPAPAPVHLLIDGVEAPFHDPQVLALDDANEHFHVVLATANHTEQGSFALVHGDASLPASSWGRSGEESYVVVTTTAPQARALASALGVPARERPAWPGRLSGLLESAGPVAAGAEHVPMRFQITNTGPVAFSFVDGGRGRNELGRDNRFTFVVERNGERLPIRTVDDFGGLGVYRRLEPQGTWTLTLDLGHWCRFDRPGQYRVTATHDAELMPAEYQPGEALPMGWYSFLLRNRKVSAEAVLTVQ
jgi:hypothetical protein